MRFRKRNWLYETNREETERRLSAVESSMSELWLTLNALGNRILLLEKILTPPIDIPEED